MADTPLICQFDQSEHADLAALHAHLRKWRVKQERYYHEYHPRRDRLTGELLPYKDYTQYHSAEFASKTNLKRWLTANKVEGLAWAIDWLRRRKEEKGLVYAPSQAELRTTMSPSIPYYDAMLADSGGYHGLAARLGFLPRYLPIELLPEIGAPVGATIIEDTREQSPLKLSVPTISRALEVGDYAFDTPHDQGIRIERKSLADFCGTMNGRLITTKGKKVTRVDSALARFAREMDRAVAANLYVVMMVESDINEAQSIGYLPQTRHVKASASYLLHNLRDMLTRYPLHLQVVFVAGRTEMAAKLVKVLSMGLAIKTLDAQLAYERGML